jgi:GNAT superfamily N-acetyltransferase
MSLDDQRPLAGLPARAVLRDGTAVCVRAIRADDKERLQIAFARLSPRSVYHRFFHPVNELTSEDLRRLTEIDFHDHVAIVLTVTVGSDERLIAIGRYVRTASGGDTAEVAFTVIDDYQGRGAAGLLLRELVAAARARGVCKLVAFVMSDNTPMLDVFRQAGLPLRESSVDGMRCIDLDLTASASTRRRARRFDVRRAIRTQWRRFSDDSTRGRRYARHWNRVQ